jgi:hypothetical protein
MWAYPRSEELWLGLRLVRVGAAAGCILIAGADTLQLQSNRPSLDPLRLSFISIQTNPYCQKSIHQITWTLPLTGISDLPPKGVPATCSIYALSNDALNADSECYDGDWRCGIYLGASSADNN